MDQIFTIIALAFVVLIVCFFFCYCTNKKYPPIVEKSDDKRNPDFYIVNTITVFRYGGGSYSGYTFVKKKDGKYKLKHSILDVLSIMISVGILQGLFFWMFIGYLINSVDPIDIKNIIAALFLFVFISGLLVLIHISEIVARIHFKKYIKREKIKG